MMPKFTMVVAAAVLLVACQQAPVRDETSDRSRVGVGSTFVLHERLIVPAGHARVFLQGGKVVAKMQLGRYRPHCNFEVRTVSDGSLAIEPDTFLVTAVEEYEEEVVMNQAQPLRVGLEIGGDDEGGGITHINRFVRHWLYSERQPLVTRLTCHGGFDVPFYAKTPSIAEIRQALGKYVTLNLVSSEE